MIESSISSPSALSKAIGIIRANLADDTLRQIVRPEEPSANEALMFLQLPEQGPWPDVVDFTFACTACGQHFELRAETYHGSGGQWRPCTAPGDRAA